MIPPPGIVPNRQRWRPPFIYTPADVAALMKERAAAKQLEFSMTCEGGIPATIRTDPVRLRQMIGNLVANAIHYTEAGQVTVRTVLDATHKQACIEVQDTGVGIQPADMPHLFERFYRVDESRSSDLGGTGLGLAIAHEIVRLHKGKIDVQSEMGKGVTLRVELPAAKQS